MNGSDIQFSVPVVDNPAAGIQEVWVTYTDISSSSGGTWQSLDLIQNEIDTTLWEEVLTVSNPSNIRYIVQAANGLGMVSMATNLGNYYIPGAEAGQGKASSLNLASDTRSSAKYGTQVSVSATLTDSTTGATLGDKAVSFFLGSIGRVALTHKVTGIATTSLPVYALPGEGGTSGENEIAVVFAGDAEYAQTSDSSLFSILKRDTHITMVDLGESGGFSIEQVLIEATLTEDIPLGRTLPEQTIIFNVTGNGLFYYKAVITDYQGRAQLGEIPLPPGDYSVDAFFSGSAHGHAFSHVDDRYNPSSASFATFTLQNTKPDGQPDSYEVDEDGVLTRSASEGVLANDTDIDSQPLTTVLSTGSLDGPFNGDVVLNADGSFTYSPDAEFYGSDSFMYFANDGIDDSDSVTVSITINAVNDPPDCSTVAPSVVSLWPSDGKMVSVSISGATDSDGDDTLITHVVTAVFQDEEVGKKVDGQLFNGSDTVKVRSERDGNGDGRVYHIMFTATDEGGFGLSCSGEVRVATVPHDQSSDANIDLIDGGPLYDSTVTNR